MVTLYQLAREYRVCNLQEIEVTLNGHKKALSETDIRTKFVNPALKDEGWDEMTQIGRQVTLTLGP